MSEHRNMIPVIDIADLRAGKPDAARRVAKEMLHAAETVGFFYIAGHGVAESLIERADKEARQFFTAPLAEKLAVEINHQHRGFLRIGESTMEGARLPDLKESFIWGMEIDPDDPSIAPENTFLGANQWPAGRPELKSVLKEFFDALNGVGIDVLKAFAVAMALDEAAFTRKFDRPISRGSAIYYPPNPNAALDADPRFGVSPHTDFGCLTLLHQDPVGGLEVRGKDDEWVIAEPIAGTFVVNVGDLLARWTNKRFASTEHRVINRSARERLSLAVFVDPDFETIVDPKIVCGADETPQYEATRCGDYILSRYQAAFAYRN